MMLDAIFSVDGLWHVPGSKIKHTSIAIVSL